MEANSGRENFVHLIVSLSQHPQNGEEQVQDIQIKGDCSPYVVVVCKALDQIVCVIYNVPRENYRTNSTVNSSGCRTEREECLRYKTT